MHVPKTPNTKLLAPGESWLATARPTTNGHGGVIIRTHPGCDGRCRNVPQCAGRSLARFVLHSGKLRHRYGRPMTLHHDLEGEGMDNGTGHYRLDSDAAVDDVAVMSRSDQSAGRAYMEWRSISARWTRSGSVPKTATAEVRRTPLLRPKAISTRTTQLYQTKRSDALVSMPEGNF